jgi:hypothetical protein
MTCKTKSLNPEKGHRIVFSPEINPYDINEFHVDEVAGRSYIINAKVTLPVCYLFRLKPLNRFR